MTARAQIAMLADGRRMHLHDGPIDLIVEAFGGAREVELAYRAAAARFVSVLDELCGELSFLRKAARVGGTLPGGTIARRMVAAVAPFASSTFITPMAAVAGAVAEEILSAMTGAAELSRAYVNDGGDIALHLSPGEKFVVGLVERPDRPSLFGTTTIDFADSVRGIATSGWRGRSFSLGIADAVTVLADTAAAADAAATVIANAVDLPGHPAIARVPACELAPDSDLGARLVAQRVGELTLEEIREALFAGVRTATALQKSDLIRSAALSLQGEVVIADHMGEVESTTAAAKQFAEKLESRTSGAESRAEKTALIAAVNRCATQKQGFSANCRVGHRAFIAAVNRGATQKQRASMQSASMICKGAGSLHA